MGGRSKSSTTSSQTTTNTQNIETTSIGLEDVEFGVAGVSGDVQVTQISTDQGSIEAGRKIGESAFEFAESQSEDAFEFAEEFGGTAIKEAFDFGDEALGTVEKGLSDVLDFGRTSLETISAQNARTTGELGKAIVSAGQATRSDASEAVSNIAKYGAIALAVGIIGYALLARKRG